MRYHSNKTVYRFAIGVTLATMLMLIWLSLGVGIIGADGDPANLMYFGVVAIGIIGAIVTRLRPFGMIRVLLVMASVQALITGITLIGKLGLPYSGPLEILLLNGFFVVAFVGAAWLFQRSAYGKQSWGDTHRVILGTMEKGVPSTNF